MADITEELRKLEAQLSDETIVARKAAVDKRIQEQNFDAARAAALRKQVTDGEDALRQAIAAVRAATDEAEKQRLLQAAIKASDNVVLKFEIKAVPASGTIGLTSDTTIPTTPAFPDTFQGQKVTRYGDATAVEFLNYGDMKSMSTPGKGQYGVIPTSSWGPEGTGGEWKDVQGRPKGVAYFSSLESPPNEAGILELMTDPAIRTIEFDGRTQMSQAELTKVMAIVKAENAKLRAAGQPEKVVIAYHPGNGDEAYATASKEPSPTLHSLQARGAEQATRIVFMNDARMGFTATRLDNAGDLDMATFKRVAADPQLSVQKELGIQPHLHVQGLKPLLGLLNTNATIDYGSPTSTATSAAGITLTPPAATSTSGITLAPSGTTYPTSYQALAQSGHITAQIENVFHSAEAREAVKQAIAHKVKVTVVEYRTDMKGQTVTPEDAQKLARELGCDVVLMQAEVATNKFGSNGYATSGYETRGATIFDKDGHMHGPTAVAPTATSGAPGDNRTRIELTPPAVDGTGATTVVPPKTAPGEGLHP